MKIWKRNKLSNSKWLISTKAGSCGSMQNNTVFRAETSHSRRTHLSWFLDATYLQNLR